MKKSLFIASLLCFSLGLWAEEESEETRGVHPYKVEQNEVVVPRFAHWSLTPHVGFNYFDGDFNNEMKHAFGYPSVGMDLEYAFTPVWGLGLNYTFDWYKVTGKKGGSNADILLDGYMHRPSLYVSMDFMNLFFPKAKRKIFSANAVAGGGYAWWKNKAMYHDDPSENPTWTRGRTTEYINEDGENAPSYMTKYQGQLFIYGGLAIGFNLNRTICLGLRATYNYFVNDYIDGRGYAGPKAAASKNNDGIVDVTLYMRFKLDAVSKTHERNVSAEETWVKTEVLETKYVHDTVIIRHDSIIIREKTIERERTTEKDLESYYYVYFANNKSTLDDKGLITVQQVAERLHDDSTLYAVVTGYCDNTGSSQFNYALGDKRASNVIEELKEEHVIDPDRMYSMGVGKVVGHRSQAAYGPNRRAAIRLVDKATFERMKAKLENERAQRQEPAVKQKPQEKEAAKEVTKPESKSESKPAAKQEGKPVVKSDVKTVPLAESARPEKVNEYKYRTSEEVTTDKMTTLAKLSRKYYNNTYCWVYIYIANKDKISNPNALVPGTVLAIPELTQKEMQITKDESLMLYGNARLGK